MTPQETRFSLTVREADAPAAVPASIGTLDGADEPPAVVHGPATHRTGSDRAPPPTPDIGLGGEIIIAGYIGG